MDILGYTVEQLRRHIERQFTKGMTWANMGQWHIDHITAIKHFKITGPDCPEFRACWALSNLRPEWDLPNIQKGAQRLFLI